MNANSDLLQMVENRLITSPGFLIKKLRKRMGMSQQDLADFLKISQSCLSKIESDHLEMGLSHWFIFCQLADIPVQVYGNFLNDYS